ncbi:MAG TPA: S16 family serine protease [Actinomycetota bacterium]|nr:S16 family serine protease [Actinomycetota bacterium]
MRRAMRYGGLALLMAGAFAVGWIPLPFFSFGPGPAREIVPLIHVEGAPTYGSSGHLVMTTIRFTQVTALGALAAWIDPERAVVEEDIVYPPGLSPSEEEQRAISQMDQSKIDAAAVALSEVTDYPREHGPGALVEFVGSGCPADGRLFPGDLIVGIGGEQVDSQREASRLIDAVPTGDPIRFRVEADGKVHDVAVTRGRCPETDEPLIGVILVEPFPFEITIESGDVGGPSAGLMWAVGLYDLLTPGDLTRGRTIAGTGSIDLEGNVGPIGGILDKVVAARDAKADIMLIPRDNFGEVRDVDSGDLRLISVSTFDEAIEALSSSEPAT